MPRSDAQTLEWGEGVGIPLIDSDGDAIDDSYKFELGAFALNFNPDESNVGEWLTHWRVFDRLIFDSVFGFSTSSTTILDNVTSESQFASDPSFSFSKLDAYIWVRNGDEPVPGSEWFLARAETWSFPEFGGDCCANEFIQWSTTDLSSSDVPVWGWQNVTSTPDGTEGSGVFSQMGFDERSVITPPYERAPAIQTHTFIPEPSSALLTLLAGFGLLLRRRRNA